MKNSMLAHKYAKALFDMASTRNSILKIAGEVKQLLEGLTEEILSFLYHPRISQKEKKYILSNALSKLNFSQELIAFVYVLINNKRVNLLKPIYMQYISMKDKSEFLTRGEIFVTQTVEEHWVNDLKQAFSKATKRKFSWTLKVDNQLLAGFRIKLGDKVIDASLKTQIERLAQEISENSGTFLKY